MQQWKIGRVRVTRIVEQTLDGELDALIPMATPERVLQHDWLVPDHVTPDGHLRFSVHALGIEADGLKIVVDTCVGNDRQRDGVPFWTGLSTRFLDALADAGFAPDTVDRVVCTHLHLDHVGWNTRRVADGWIPTFPNARYLFGRVEYEHALAELGLPNDGSVLANLREAVFGDAIQPVVAAGLVDLVETDHAICSSVHLVATPGHTPGHVSVAIVSEGERALITGDAIHHPCQLAAPDWGTLADDDQDAAALTRRQMLAACAADRRLVIGSHWAGSSAGQIVADGTSYRLE